MVSKTLKFIWVVMAITGILNINTMALAEEKKDDGIIRESSLKEVTGEVAGVSKNFIAVMYGVDNEKKSALEMAFGVTKDARIENKRNLTDIQIGDIVSVTYEDKTERKKEEKIDKAKIISRTVKKIVYIRAGSRMF